MRIGLLDIGVGVGVDNWFTAFQLVATDEAIEPEDGAMASKEAGGGDGSSTADRAVVEGVIHFAADRVRRVPGVHQLLLLGGRMS